MPFDPRVLLPPSSSACEFRLPAALRMQLADYLAPDHMAQAAKGLAPADLNLPCPALAPLVRSIRDMLRHPLLTAACRNDALMEALRVQTLTHLEHVCYDFRCDHADYPHAPVLSGPYAFYPAQKALAKAALFFCLAAGETPPATLEKRPIAIIDCHARHRADIQAITRAPRVYYTKFRRRLEQAGHDAGFAEYIPVAHILLHGLTEGTAAQALARADRRFAALARHAAAGLQAAADAGCPYLQSIAAIERAVEVFDILQRVQKPQYCPPLYHSRRYEYYMHYLSAQSPGHIFFPTTLHLGVTDLLRVRGVPIGFIGVNMDVERVDGFYQSPYEFFMHDVNHSRRMYQFGIEEAGREGLADEEFYARTARYTAEKLIPLIAPRKEDDAATRTARKVAKMILFEILHEDALPATPDCLRRALLRPPSQLTPFERIEGDTVVHIMEPGATTLAYVFRKLAHTFYDTPEDRKGYIVDDAARSRQAVAQMAAKLFSLLSLGAVPAGLLARLAATDAGFPDDFRRELEADIARRQLAALEETPEELL